MVDRVKIIFTLALSASACYHDRMQAEILHCDMEELRDDRGRFADLIVADPPYNLSIEYDGYRDNLTPEEYRKRARLWCQSMAAMLVPTGSLWVIINEQWHPFYRQCLDELGLHWRNTVIWNYGFGPKQDTKFTPSHACLLYYVASPDRFTFNQQAVAVQSERQKMGDKRANPAGKTPDDVWSIPRVCGTFNERVPGVPTQLPEELVERIVRVSSNVGDTVVDPFCGSGTTAVVCERLNRPCVTCDQSSSYVAIARRRLQNSRRTRNKSTTS
jgi:DNA modification methylase